MSCVERDERQHNESFDPADMVANTLSGRIRHEDLSENDQVVMDYYIGLMFDDPKFESEVRKRLAKQENENTQTKINSCQDIEKNNTIEIAAQIGLGRIKVTYLSEDIKNKVFSLQKEAEENLDLRLEIINRENDLALLPVHKSEKKRGASGKKNKKKDDLYIQPSLLPLKESVFTEQFDYKKSKLEEKIDKGSKKVNSRYGGRWDDELKKEVEYKKNELRKIIGLPVAKRSSGNENNMFYRFLVRRVIAWDVFGIFGDYCSSTSGVTADLESKIRQVTETLHVLLSKDSGLNLREKFRYFDSFLQEYRQKWG